ncbi:MAG: hypothetical protein IPM16_11245 [Chloroflexi bacterium]|nr:hypothetical protein [Chloroflexota bacterium]
MVSLLPSTNRTFIFVLAAVIVVSIGIVAAAVTQGLNARTVAAALLTFSFVQFLICGTLFTGRAILMWTIADATRFMRWERGSNIISVCASALGLVLLALFIGSAETAYLAVLGASAYLIGAVLIIVAETRFLSDGTWINPQVVIHMISEFAAQACVGATLIGTGLVPTWVGWAAIGWNIACPVGLVLMRPKDFYFPVMHYVAPLIIGIALFAAA